MHLQIGVCVMVHGDNKGLVLPPRVAPLQVIIVPISASSDAPEVVAGLVATMKQIEADLKAVGVRVKIDDRDNYLPGWKYAHWEQKVRGVWRMTAMTPAALCPCCCDVGAGRPLAH